MTEATLSTQSRTSRLTRIALSAVLGLVSLFILLQLSILAVIVWLHTPQGHRQVNTAVAGWMAGSGYTLDIGGFGYRPFNKVSLKDIIIKEGATGLTVAIDRITVRVSLAPLPKHRLQLSVRARDVDIISGTIKAAVTPYQPLTPENLDMGDMFVREIDIRQLRVKNLRMNGSTIAEKISGDLQVSFGDKINFAADIKADAPVIKSMPVALSFAATLDPRTGVAAISRAEISGEACNGTIAGEAGLFINGRLDLKTQAVCHLFGNAHAEASLTGTVDQPLLLMKAAYEPAAGIAEGLTPVQLSVEGKNLYAAPRIAVKAQARYATRPISFAGNLLAAGDDWRIEGVDLKIPGISARGGATVSAAGQPKGQFDINIDSLSTYAPTTAPDDLPRGRLRVGFVPAAKGFDIRASGSLRLRGQTFRPDIDAFVPDSFDRVSLRRFLLNDAAGGKVSASGDYAVPTSAMNIAIKMTRFSVPPDDTLSARLSADLQLEKRDATSPLYLRGDIKPDVVEVTIPEQFSSSIPRLNVKRPVLRGTSAGQAGGIFQRVLLDIALSAPRRIYVRGWGLDAEFKGDLRVTGDMSAPEINGQMSTVRARYEEFGKRFTIDRGLLRFEGKVPPSPYLDIKAVTDTGDIEAAIVMTGPVSKPVLSFASTPALPKDEVLARILFGRQVRGLSPFEAIRLADTLRRFTGEGGGGGFNPLQSFRKATGFDDVRVEQDSNGNASFGIGKYITDKVYLEFRKGQGNDTGGANVQIDLSRKLKLESEVGRDNTGAGLSWKWDY